MTRTNSKDDSAFMTAVERQQTADCWSILSAAIAAVNPEIAVRNALHMDTTTRNSITLPTLRVRSPLSSGTTVEQRSYDLSLYGSIVVVAFGKASAAMASAVVKLMVDNVSMSSILPLEGVVICKDGHATVDQVDFMHAHNVTVYEASHPIPDERGVQASQRLLNLVRRHGASGSNGKKSLIIACLSGGGSALFCTPKPGLTLADLQATNTALLQTGWNIQTVNAIRKVLEEGKGGGLARAAVASGRCDVVSLILSDVLGDPLDLIASGPTVVEAAANRAIQEAWKLVSQRPSHVQFPNAIADCIQAQYKASRLQQQLPPPATTTESSCWNCLVGNNALAVQAAAATARALGYQPIVLGTQWQGEAATVGQVLVAMAQHVQKAQPDFLHHALDSGRGRNVALIAGGETTVTLPSDPAIIGRGGRNQELALAAALALQQYQLRNVVVASVGTDGTDGPTDAAGAIVDGRSVDRIHASLESGNDGDSDATNEKETAVQALQRHNAYPYLGRKDAMGHSHLVKVSWRGVARKVVP
jgi:glycerate 2-kinase